MNGFQWISAASVHLKTYPFGQQQQQQLPQQQRSRNWKNQNLTLGFSQPEVTHWETSLQLSSAVNNSIIVLGVLTFALQLCLVLFFMLRCWAYDNRLREALKQPDTVQKLWLAPSTFHHDTLNNACYQICDDDTPPVSQSAAAAGYKELDRYETTTNSLPAPFIHWDLVQS